MYFSRPVHWTSNSSGSLTFKILELYNSTVLFSELFDVFDVTTPTLTIAFEVQLQILDVQVPNAMDLNGVMDWNSLHSDQGTTYWVACTL